MDLLRIAVCSFLLALSTSSFAQIVNINQADAGVIAQALKGVGVNKAALVVEYRETHGPFTSIEEIALVKGIGSRTVDLNRDNIVVE